MDAKASRSAGELPDTSTCSINVRRDKQNKITILNECTCSDSNTAENDLSDEEFQRARRGPHNHLHYTDFLHLRYEWQFAAISALNER